MNSRAWTPFPSCAWGALTILRGRKSWIYGINLAATPLWLKLPEEGGLRMVRGLLDKVFDLAVLALVFRLFFRFTHAIEARLPVWTAKSESKLDDYLNKPHNPFQIRSRVMVAMRWLTYMDSITWKRYGAGGTALKQAASGEGNAA